MWEKRAMWIHVLAKKGLRELKNNDLNKLTQRDLLTVYVARQ